MRAAYAAAVDEYEGAFADDLAQLELDRRVLDTLARDVARDGLVLDAGCGPGHLAEYLSAAGATVVGLDFTYRMLEAASQRVHGLAVMAGDVRALPMRSGAVGGLVAFYVFQHVRRHEFPRALAECRRVLRAGGLLVTAVHEGAGEFAVGDVTGNLYTATEVVDRLNDASFTVEAVDRRAPLPHERQGDRCYVLARAT